MTKKEMQALIAELRATIVEQAQRIKELEEQLNKNSKNSSKPPSSDVFKKPVVKSLRQPSGKKPGAQWGHKGNKGLKFPEIPDEIVTHLPNRCAVCPDREKCEAESQVCEKRNEIDIEVRPIYKQHQSVSRRCPKTGEVHTGDFPANVTGTLQYGVNLKALAISLNTMGMMSINRTQDILQSVFGLQICTGTVSAMVKSGAAIVNPTVIEIKEAIKNEEIVGLDETGTRVDKSLMWAHVASTALLTYISVEESRGKIGMESAGIVPFIKNIGVHDCFASYFTFDFVHALCCAHVLRELTGIFDNYQQKWAVQMIELFVKMKQTKENLMKAGKTEADPETWEKFSAEFDELTTLAISENPLLPPIKPGNKPKRNKPRVLAERLAERKAEYLLFFTNFNVPFDNNQAERDFRLFKVKQKVSGCFRTKDGADDFASIMSFLSTARKLGLSAFVAIRDALLGKPFSLNSSFC